MFEILIFFLACIGILWLLEKIFEAYIVSKYLSETVDNSNELPDNDDWVMPLKLAHMEGVWYAWDKDDVFVMQALTKDELIINILNKYDISPKRIKIEYEEKVGDTRQKTNL